MFEKKIRKFRGGIRRQGSRASLSASHSFALILPEVVWIVIWFCFIVH